MKRLVLNMVYRFSTDSCEALVRMVSSDSDGVLMRVETSDRQEGSHAHSGKALVYPNRGEGLRAVGSPIPNFQLGSRAKSSPIPLFLRDVGKYYWNYDRINKEYNTTLFFSLVEIADNYGYTRMLPFFTRLQLLECRKIKSIQYGLEKGIIKIQEYLSHGSGRGDLAVVKLLISLGADITPVRNRILFLASRGNDPEMVKYAIEKGATDAEVLVHASGWGHFDSVKCLVENGIDVHYAEDRPLKIAFQNKEFGIAKYLIEKGANATIGLHLALEKGNLEMAKYCTEHGADFQEARKGIFWLAPNFIETVLHSLESEK